jgi:hypothetical protein
METFKPWTWANGGWLQDSDKNPSIYKTIRRLKTTKEQDEFAHDILLDAIVNGDGYYFAIGGPNCITKTNGIFDKLKNNFGLKEENLNPKNYPDPKTGRDSGVSIISGDYEKDLNNFREMEIINRTRAWGPR